MSDRPYRTAAEVALELGVSLRTVRRLIADGRLRATRVGRSVRIPVDAYRDAPLPSSAGAVSGIEGRPPSGPSDTADAILDAGREEFGAGGVPRLPGGERAGGPDTERPGAVRPGRRLRAR